MAHLDPLSLFLLQKCPKGDGPFAKRWCPPIQHGSTLVLEFAFSDCCDASDEGDSRAP